MRYEITTLCTAASGMERLRNQREFILLAYPSGPDATADEMISGLTRDIQSCARPNDFDYEAARKAIADWADDGGREAIARELAYIEWGEDEADEWDCEDSPAVRLYVADNSEGEE